MKIRSWITALGLAGVLATPVVADDIEVLARGPVHEAYAEPSEREPRPTPIVPKEPPQPIEELPPDQKPEGENVQWLPGYWAWDLDKSDFLWVSGFWRVAPPGRSWVPGSWRQAADGWQWTGGFWTEATAGQAQVEYLPQPPAPLDVQGPVTPAPSENHTYVTGSWVYRDRYVWRPGYWIEHRPNWVWISAHYRWTPAGCVFIDGYWDYPLASRGVLFAPCYIPPTVYTVPNYVFTPTVVVREECLYGAFFARRGYGGYYFGDYFAPRYAGFGFTAWSGHVSASVSIGGWWDPLYSHYRCGYRNDPFWRGGISDLYVGRYRGDFARPPVTLVQQNTVINNITNSTTIVNKNTTINNVQMLTSIRNQNRVGDLNIRRVSDGVVRSDAAAARDLRATATRRGQQETQLAAATRPGRPAGPQRATLDVPVRPTVARPEPKTGAAIARPTPANPRPTPAGAAVTRPGTVGRPKADPQVDPTPRTAVARPKVDPVTPRPGPAAKLDATPRPGPAAKIDSTPRPGRAPAKVDATSRPAVRPAPSAIPNAQSTPRIPPARIEPTTRPAPAKTDPTPRTAPRPMAPVTPQPAARAQPKAAPTPKAVPAPRPSPPKKEEPTPKRPTVAAASPAPVYRAAKPTVSQPAPQRTAPRPSSIAPRPATPIRAANKAPAALPRTSNPTPRPQVAPRPAPATQRAAPRPAPAVQRSAPRPSPAIQRAAPRPASAVQRAAPRPQPAMRAAPKASVPATKPAAKSAIKPVPKKK